MDAQQILAALDAAGVEVLTENGRMALSKPPPADLLAAIQANREGVRSAWLEREWLAYIESRPLRTDDPRPDLAEDNAAWTLLLNRISGVGNVALREALHGLRCLGARLVRTCPALRLVAAGPSLRLVAGDEMSAEEYAAAREQWLLPCAAELSEALTRVGAQLAEQTA